MTRARAIELLKGIQICCDLDDCTNAWDCDECVEALCMAIKALEHEPKWIPVTERLPEEGLTVLIFTESGDIEFGQRDENKWEWLAESIADYWTANDYVIAWQPLPKRMESEENGND